jgi:hypothetical protein
MKPEAPSYILSASSDEEDGAYLANSHLSIIEDNSLISASDIPFASSVLTALVLESSETGMLSLSLR